MKEAALARVETKVILQGKIYSKKNSQRIVRFGRIPSIRPSKAFEAWHAEQVAAFPKCEKLIPPYDISITIYPPDKRACDLTNQAESVNDLLVDVGMLEDDNWFVLGSVTLRFGEVDRKNPRAEITILSSAQNNSELAA